MSTFAVLLLCIEACLVQNVFGQACLGANGLATAPAVASPCSWIVFGQAAPMGWAFGLAYDGPAAAGHGAAAYGSAGEGDVAVAGELPVAGNTSGASQVPIMGAVSFSGPTAAAGAVSIEIEVADVSGLTAP